MKTTISTKLVCVLLVVLAVAGCSKDECPSYKNLLTGPLWILEDVDNDDDGDYEDITYLEVEFDSDGTYYTYMEDAYGYYYESDGEWELDCKDLDLDGDDFKIKSANEDRVVIEDDDGVVLTFEAD